MPNFVKFFYRNRYDEVDWTKQMHFLDKELQALQVGSRPKDRIADMLVMLHLKNGSPLYVFLHIEIQGYSDEYYDLRIHQMRNLTRGLWTYSFPLLGNYCQRIIQKNTLIWSWPS